MVEDRLGEPIKFAILKNVTQRAFQYSE